MTGGLAALALALAVPLTAAGQTATQGPSTQTTPSFVYTPRGPAGPGAGTGRDYPVLAHSDSGEWKDTAGWGVFATAQGRSMDLATRDQWVRDPRARPGEMKAGFGWREHDMSFMVGYAHSDSGAHPLVGGGTRDLVGMNLVFHLQ